MPGQDPNLIRTVDQCTTGVAPGQPCEHGIANITFRSPNWGALDHGLQLPGERIDGAGLAQSQGRVSGVAPRDNQTNHSNDQFLSYRLNNGVPNQFTQTINRFTRHQWVRTAAFYVQDSYTTGRFTFQGALRYDHAWSFFPEQESSRCASSRRARPIRPPRSSCDLTPRGGVAMDVFGNGKDVAEVQLRRYLEAAQNAGFFITNNPIGRLSTTVSRTWTDTNNNKVVDCNLLSQLAQSPATTGSIDTCGVGSPNFGTDLPAQALDPSLTTGWALPGDWQWGTFDPAGDYAARVGRVRLPAPLAAELQHHGQPSRQQQ